MATITTHNGVAVDRLVATVGAVQDDPNLAKFTFRARSSWETGGRNRGTIQEFEHAGATTTERPAPFELVGDEPPVLLGTNAGLNAVELVLQALAFRYAVGYAYNAAARGMEIEELRYEIEGDLDLHRFLGLGGPRAGFSEIRAKSWVRSPNATQEQLEELCQYVPDTSPVRDISRTPFRCRPISSSSIEARLSHRGETAVNLYEEAVLRDWRDRAARRGQQALRRTAVEPDWRLPVAGSPHGNALAARLLRLLSRRSGAAGERPPPWLPAPRGGRRAMKGRTAISSSSQPRWEEGAVCQPGPSETRSDAPAST